MTTMMKQAMLITDSFAEGKTVLQLHVSIVHYYTALLNAVECSVHLHGPFTSSGDEIYFIMHRC